MRCFLIIRARWKYGFNAFVRHFLARLVAIVSSVSNQAFWISSHATDSNCLQGRQHQFHFRDAMEVTFPHAITIKGFAMELGTKFMDFPREVKVELKTPEGWREITREARLYPTAEEFASLLQRPKNPAIYVHCDAIRCEGARLVLLSEEKKSFVDI
jgi:hypothetical protein